MKKIYFTAFLITCLLIMACDKEVPPIVDPPELITTLTYTLIADSDGSEVVMSFVDLDGDGGDSPVINSGILKANDSYTGALELLNESLADPEDITEEIREEDEDHQFFFQSNTTGLTVEYADTDMDGNPIGLSTRLLTGDVGEGILTIILRHEPNKSGMDVSLGDITNAGGETDIQVTFDINVE